MRRAFRIIGLLLAGLLANTARAGSPVPAVRGIVDAFATHPVVAIAETHGIRQAGDFYVALVRDPGFQRVVDDIVVEFASGQSQVLLDRYVVDGADVPMDTLRSIWRNTTKVVSWESPVYARWLAAIRDVNRTRPAGHRIRVLAGDTPVDWSRLRTRADWDALGGNDVSFARVIEGDVLAKHHRALVVLGSNHLGHGGSFRDGSANTTTRLDAHHPGAVFVALMYAGWPGGEQTEARIGREAWPRPSLVALGHGWPGDLAVSVATPLAKRADALLYLGSTKDLDPEPALRQELETYDTDELDRRSVVEWGDSTKARRFVGLGAVREYELDSRLLGATRRLWVYTPAAYARNGAAADLLVVFDGGEYLGPIPLPSMLDSLIAAKRMPATVAVMLDDASGRARLDDLANHERFAKFVASELVPWVRRNWNVATDPRRCTMTGSSAGGLAAAFVALRHPDLFGNVLSQSGAYWRGAEGTDEAPFEWLTAQFQESPKLDLRFFLDVGSTESRGAMNGKAPSILVANRHLRDTLRARGYEVSYTEVEGGSHAPESWRQRLPAGLEWIANARHGGASDGR
jgi:enterochelin esterase-like enzyme